MGYDPTKAFKGDLRVLVSDGPFMDREPVVINCINPDHEDASPSLSVYPDGAKCWGCGMLYSVYRFASEWWGCDEATARERIKSGVLPPPVIHPKPQRSTPDTGMLTELVQVYHSNLGQSEWDYFFSRGLTGEAIKRAKLGYTGTAYSIPVYGKGGELQTIRYRRDDSSYEYASTSRYVVGKGSPKYWGTRGLNDTYLYVPPLFDFDRPTLGGYAPVVLCEGELDSLLLASYGIRAVSFTNGAGSVKPEMVVQELGECSKVLVCMDNDPPGKEAAYAARAALVTAGVDADIVKWRAYKDVTELWQHNRMVFANWVAFLSTQFAI